MKFTLRTRLALLYGALVALTTAVFGVVAYYTVSNELYHNLDTSLLRACTGLLAVVQREHDELQRPLEPVRQRRGDEAERSLFAFLQRSSLRDFVGPVPVPDSVLTEKEDPVWTAVYEHVLLNSSTYLLQVRSADGNVVWRSENLLADTLPQLSAMLPLGERTSDRVAMWMDIRGVRYRVAAVQDSVAEVAAAYPVDEVDATLRRLFSLLLYAIPTLIVISMFMGWFMARRALKPVDSIVRAARRITAERLAERLPVTDSKDEIGRLIETLNEMIARLERSFEQVRQFTADASHELKTPLAIMMGEVEVALRAPDLSEGARQTLESCLEEVVRLTHVVQGLLDLSKAESGQLSIEKRPVEVSVMIADLADVIEILAEKKNIRVEANIQPNLVVTGDAVRLHQAFLNVLENAVKYTLNGGLVVITLTAEFQHVVLKVADTGVGIPQDQISKIFDRFYRVDHSRSQEIQGTGLGLSIVKWIVETHGGTITVQSTPGEGTNFTITLPRAT